MMVSFEGLELVKEPVSFSVGFSGAAFFCALVVFIDVLELLLALLGAPVET